MKKKHIKIVKLEKIIGNKNQIEVLYQLLIKREHNISNISLPTINEHIKFVKNHPYRAWYLIKINKLYVGSAYLMKTNCIGISLLSDTSIFPEVIHLIFKKHSPLKEIKSVRPSYFFINIAPNNRKIKSQLVKIRSKKIQSTYSLASI